MSKNNYKDIKEVFNKKNMPLTFDDFVSVKVNWEAKSQNILEIVNELNIGLESVIFIDDNIFEIEEVKTSLDIDTVQVSKDDPFSNLTLLDTVLTLQSLFITSEDKQKDKFYKDEKKRTEVKNNLNSLEDYVKSLNIKI